MSVPHRDRLTNKQVGMFVGLSSMGMLFGTLILSYMLARARAEVWPPIGVDPVPPLLPGLSSASLIASSLLLHAAFLRLRENNLEKFQSLWKRGTIFGFLFLVFQAMLLWELGRMGVFIDSHIFGSIVYTLIGFHAVHILAGLALLVAVARRSARYSSSNFEGPQLVGWFWHFLDVVWIAMFVLIVWK